VIEVSLPLENLDQDGRRALAVPLADADGGSVDVTNSAVQVDLIVIATPGPTDLGHLLRERVAERVVRMPPCPVLTIRPPSDRSHGLRTKCIRQDCNPSANVHLLVKGKTVLPPHRPG